MDDALSKLSATYGVEDFYISASGEYRLIPDDVKLGILDAMGVNPNDAVEAAALAIASSSEPDANIAKCFVPHWLQGGRAWGLTTQLYGVRSDRNMGIGDFEDLARLAELAAAHGADFIGVNPVHALFWEDPDRCSPYFPSTRQFLSPLYIAIDRVQGSETALQSYDPELFQSARDCPTVDYRTVSRLKFELLRKIFDGSAAPSADPSFLKFCDEGGDSLEQFCRFETLSGLMAEAGMTAGWLNWPPELHDSRSAAVTTLLADEQRKILWHKWMQWLAHEQLAEAQHRALRSGMRIGLYLDIAVGVAPDGAATWADPNLVTAKARIGCPPDAFNPWGQDWGLAPIIPSALHHRGLEPFEDVVKAAAQFAGAIRIDHVMGLEHLYWIPEGRNAQQGGYVRYPRDQMLEVIGRLSQSNRTIVIGEDLGTVPHDFRDRMLERAVHSYRVFYFERGADGSFPDPSAYPAEALACVGTHDLPTLRGWWTGADIATRLALGLITQSEADAEEVGRRWSRSQLLSALARVKGIAPDESVSGELPDHAVIDIHAYMAATPSRLFAAQLEDLVGAIEQMNLPGTHMEYPNWRNKLPIKLEDAFDNPLALQTIAAIARARPRTS
jgi:4-alpha-glucanotransferase